MLETAPVEPVPTVADLFLGFVKISISGFGGVLAWARLTIVEQKRWMTAEQFNELFAFCQFMPGANIVNFAFAFGARHRGLAGAAASVLGLLAAPMCIVMLLGGAYARWGGLPAARHALAGLAAAAAGLVLGTALRIATPIFGRLTHILIALGVLALVLLLHFSLPFTMLIILPVALFCSWRSA